MTSPNGLICFTNCLLPLEDGSLVEKDLWVDERRGVILDSQRTFFLRKQRPDRVIDLKGNVLSPGLIDTQINGAYGFDFSVYDGDDAAYRAGLRTVAEKIVETGVTSLLPTVITQEAALYPRILPLLTPTSAPRGAHLLGWHCEGPFLQPAKRGAHASPFLLTAPSGIESLEDVYGAPALAHAEDWLLAGGVGADETGVRVITAAPEVKGVMESVAELARRGVVFSIGHSIATTAIASAAVQQGARLITHLFNAMPQLHHRDPSIIGLLGSSPHLASPFAPITAEAPSVPPSPPLQASSGEPGAPPAEALDEQVTPPQTPLFKKSGRDAQRVKGLGPSVKDVEVLDRPFYELIVDGVHSHPNSVRLAYSSFPEGCILITDAMKILDPHLRDGVHEWRDGQRFVKEGDKLYLEGTDTLAGSVVTLDKCVRNFTKFTGCTLGQALKCATLNPARCLGIENKKGTLRPGADADLVVMDKAGHVLATWVKGVEVWTRG